MNPPLHLLFVLFVCVLGNGIVYRDRPGRVASSARATDRPSTLPTNPLVKRPVLLLPGIGGSMLLAKPKNVAAAPEVVWVRLLWADAKFARLLGAFNHSIDFYENQAEEVFCPDEDASGLYGVDTLDATSLLPQARYFHDLIGRLVVAGYAPGRTLFGHCWDWRQRVTSAALQRSLLQRLVELHHQTGQRVDVVAHSLGALLLRSLLASEPSAAEHVANFVSLGAPWLGGGGRTVESLVAGYTLGHILVSKSTAQALARTSPIAFQVLPAASTKLRVSFMHAGRYNVLSDVDAFVDMIANDTRGNAAYDRELLLKVRADRRRWMAWAGSPLVHYFNIYGVGQDTPFDITFPTNVSEPTQLWSASAAPVYSFVDGDGSVPTASALADGMAAADRQAVRAEHLALLAHEDTARHVLRVLDVACSWRGRFRVTDDRASTQWVFETSPDERTFNAVGERGVRVCHGNVSGLAVAGEYDAVQHIELKLSLDCQTFEGTRRFTVPTADAPAVVRGLRVDAGDCDAGQQSCRVANGFGWRHCVAGAWGPCFVHACRPGFEPAVGLGSVRAAPQRFTQCRACREGYWKLERGMSPCAPCRPNECVPRLELADLLLSAAPLLVGVAMCCVLAALCLCWAGRPITTTTAAKRSPV